MTLDLSAANDFMATRARVLDRRRFELLNGETDPSAALAALDGYRNPDGGYGWAWRPTFAPPKASPELPARLRGLRGHRAGDGAAGRGALRLAGLDQPVRRRAPDGTA